MQTIKRNKKSVFIAILLLATIFVAFLFVAHVPSSKLQNCVWLLPSSEGLELLNNVSLWHSMAVRLESANINGIIVCAGWWNSDHTIKYADSPSVWSQFINSVKSTNSNFKVLAYVNGWGIDISDPLYRTEMLSAVKQLMFSAPFDGMNDDLENFTGTTQNLIDYWQAEANLVKGMGKIATVDLTVGWSYNIEDVYPYLTNFDYVMPMFYQTIEDANAQSYWNRILSSSHIPVIMGLDVDQEEMNNFPLSQQLSWIDRTISINPHSNLVGFSIWAYDYWDAGGVTSNDFAAWTNWATKNTIGIPTTSTY